MKYVMTDNYRKKTSSNVFSSQKRVLNLLLCPLFCKLAVLVCFIQLSLLIGSGFALEITVLFLYNKNQRLN